MDKYIDAQQEVSQLWALYHNWYDKFHKPIRMPRMTREQAMAMFRDYPRILKGEVSKESIYKELRRKSAKKHLAWKKYLDILRFEAFSQLFYDRMRVDIAFAQRLICSYIR
tara:strand:+ start:378 stop:710 length:333 start_codon:yes stop_codon:yes gene_type:complete